MRIGPYQLANNLILAPMAGVTDRPFRQLCRTMGAGLAVSEMVTSNSLLYGSAKTRRRADHTGESAPVSVQIAGADPALMAEAARYNVDAGAQIIDINMGCPAKKVCNVMAGSALLQDEALVERILAAVVKAVEVPVTLKIRTGWDQRPPERARDRADRRGGGYPCAGDPRPDAGLHVRRPGRVRDDRRGQGGGRGSRSSPTGTWMRPRRRGRCWTPPGRTASMIGRAALGNPWIFREIVHFLATGRTLPPPDVAEVRRVLLAHLDALYAFYGERRGVSIARKHIGWYTKGLPDPAAPSATGSFRFPPSRSSAPPWTGSSRP